jgi:cytochrome c oxidase subunit 1
MEWAIPNPTPVYNYAVPPVIESLDDFWRQKYTEDHEGRPVRRAEADQLLADLEYVGNNPPAPVHLPNPSYFPLLTALGMPFVAWGIMYHLAGWGKALIVVGALTTIASLIGWGIEPLEDEPHEEEPHEPDESEEIEPHEEAEA